MAESAVSPTSAHVGEPPVGATASALSGCPRGGRTGYGTASNNIPRPLLHEDLAFAIRDSEDRLVVVCDECVTLFHGTSSASADAIVANGFRIEHIDDLASRVASRYALTQDQVLPVDSFANTTRRDDSGVYLTPSFSHALGYVGICGESQAALLCYAYGILHDVEPQWLSHDPERDAWVRQQIVSSPAMVEVALPRSKLSSSQLAELKSWEQLRTHGLESGLDIVLPVETVSQYVAGKVDVDFCICRHDIHAYPRICMRPECPVCEALKAAMLVGVAAHEIDGDDWFTCPPRLSRLDGQPPADSQPRFACAHATRRDANPVGDSSVSIG